MSRNSRLSRIGSRTIDLHPDMLVALTADGSTLCVHGKLGTLRLPLSTRIAIETCGEHSITLREKDGRAISPEFSNGDSCPNIVTSPNSTVPKLKNRDIKATLGLSRTLIQNMVTGVNEGFRKKLMLTGVGYRAEIQTSPRANAKTNNKSSSSNAADTRTAPSSTEPEGSVVRLFVGYSHPVDLPIPTGIEVTVPNPTSIEVFGIEKDKVGHFASRIRKVRPPEPYKGKGISYVGEHIRRKLAKSKK